MKKYQLTLLALIGSAMVCGAHGPGHSHRNEKAGDNVKSQDLCPSATAGETGTGSALKSGKSFKECIQEVPDKSWNATFTSAWESRHIHNGVNVALVVQLNNNILKVNACQWNSVWGVLCCLKEEFSQLQCQGYRRLDVGRHCHRQVTRVG